MSEFDYPKAIVLNSSAKADSDRQIDYWGLFNRFILSKWYVYVAFGVISLAFAYYYYKQQQPVFGITSKLLIRERKQDFGPAEDFVQRSVNFSATSEEAINEKEILTSFSLMTSIVQELGLDKRYFWKNKSVETDAYRNFPISVDTFTLNPIENTTFKITPLNKYSFQFSQGKFSGVYRFGKLFTNHFGTFLINKRDKLPASKSENSMNVSFLNPGAVAKGYLQNLDVSFSDSKNNSSVLILTMRDAVPQRGIDLMNRLLEKYNQIKSEANTEITLKTLEMIDERLADISTELASAENSVESFKLRNDIISETTSDLNATLDDVSGVVKEQRELDVQLNTLKNLRAELKDTSGGFRPISVNPGLYDGKIVDLVRPYNELQSERERYLSKGGFANPVIQANTQKLNNLRTSINSTLDNMESDLNLKMNRLQSQYNKSASRLRSVPIKERGLSDKVRIQSVKESLYVYLLQKREETALALVSDYTSAMVVDPPYSSLGPVAPNKIKIFAAAGVGGGAAMPFFLILLMELLFSSVRTEKDIKDILPEKNIVGVITHNRAKNKQLVIGEQPQSLLTERFRSLRTNLQFYHREKSKCILVTSSTSNEGKTFVATNLAMSFALAKKKTIIIDFDLRKPSINRYFQGNPEIGLSSYFIEELSIDDIIQHSASVSNLHYISGGTVVPGLMEMITEAQLDELFAYLKARYDVIIIDSSPIGLISDGILLNTYVDNSLYVVRSGFTKKEMVEKAKEIFAQNKLVNPSIIFNGVKRRDDAYGYSYKQYGYSQN